MEAVLFDMDGVLLDSEGPGFDRIRNTLSHKGVEVPLQTLLDRYVGMHKRTIFQELIKEYGFHDTVDELLAEHRRVSGSYYQDGQLVMIPGLLPFIQKLRQRGLPLAVVSSTASVSVLAALNRLSLLTHFSAVVCGDHVKQPKPAPEGYRMAAGFLCAQPEGCLVIEDSPLGIQAAKSAGMRVAGLKAAGHVLDTSGADLEAASFEELAGLLRL